MVRLKFLLFALLVLGLGLAHLPLLSGPLGSQAVQVATQQTASGISGMTHLLEVRRTLAREAALTLAASPRLRARFEALLSPEGPERLKAENFAPIRKAAAAELPPELSAQAVVAVVMGGEAQHARLAGEQSSTDGELDVTALARGGVQVADAFGVPHAFASVPVLWDLSDVEPEVMASLVVGVPLVPERALDDTRAASGAAALLLVKGDKAVGAAGPERALAEGALSKLTSGQAGQVLQRGQLELLGPVGLPLFTHGDALGGQAPLVVGSRRPVEGTPYEVLALATTRSTLAPLADYQRNALFALAGLLGLGLVWTALMGSGRARGAEAPAPSQDGDTLGVGAAPPAQPVSEAPLAQPAPLAQALRAPAPEASDDFPFPPPAPESGGSEPFAQPPPPAPASDDFGFPPPPVPGASGAFAFPPPGAADAFPFPPPEPDATAPYPIAAGMQLPPPPGGPAMPAAMPFDPEPPFASPAGGVNQAGPRPNAYDFEDQPTAAYSLQQAADPFAAASAQSGFPEDSNPETTRVAPIPRELLQASALQGAEAPVPLAPPRAAMPPPPAYAAAQAIPMPPPAGYAPVPMPGAGNAVALSDEQHYQDVFREFVSTRERCGEAADGLTYEKFVQKLRKNTEQLVQKYACRTVRFQVYVKEGKAALKATPVKD